MMISSGVCLIKQRYIVFIKKFGRRLQSQFRFGPGVTEIEHRTEGTATEGT